MTRLNPSNFYFFLRSISLSIVLAFAQLTAYGQFVLTTAPPLADNSGAGGISFNIHAGTDIEITEIHNIFYEFNQNYTIWYSKDSINGNPFISENAGWIRHQSGTIIGDGRTQKVVSLNTPIRIFAGETYGFYIEGNSRFMTGSTLPFLFSDANIRINTGTNVGYGGPINPTTHIRQFVGSVKYNVLPGKGNDMGAVGVVNGINCPGPRDINVLVRNFGNNTVNNLTLNWSVDGQLQTPTTYNNAINPYTGIGTNLATITAGSWNFSAGQTYVFRFWTSNPNGGTDSVQANDTFTVILGSAFSGSYTIGGSNPDFPTITEAIHALVKYGVCGPSTFTVRNGNYQEQMVFEKIPGVSSSNTILFEGETQNGVVVSHAGVSGNPATIYLKGTEYLTLKNFTIRNTSSTNSVGIQLMNRAANNVIDNNIILLDTTLSSVSSLSSGIVASSSLTGVTSSGVNAFDNIIQNNKVYGGYYGIRLNGESTTSFNTGNKLINNELRKFYYYGIYLLYQGNTLIERNNINAQSSYTYAYSIYLSSSIDANIHANRLEHIGTYGIYLSSMNVTLGTKTTISNNMIGRNYIGTGTRYGIYASNAHRVDLFHNTIVSSPSGTNQVVYLLSTSRNFNVRNNIFISNTGVAFYAANTAVISEMDYNFYYTPTTNLLYLGANFANLQTAKTSLPQFNANSMSKVPDFISANSLYLNSLEAPRGAYVGLDVDFDNDPRCVVFPSVGADESTFGMSLPIAGFTHPDTLWQGSEQDILNLANASDAKSHRWYLNNVLVSSDLNLTYDFPNTGMIVIKLVSENCGGIDSFEVNILVSAPTAPPVADFSISNRNPEVYIDHVQLTDNSSRGASSWEWIITPDEYFDPEYSMNMPTVFYQTGNNNSRNPEILFSKDGIYDICLVATNAMGSDTLCRKEFIQTKASINICTDTLSDAESGFLYDDGGYFTNYTGGSRICNILIDPCASEVFLQIHEFDLKTGDYLRIYDGKDSTGTPLWNHITYPQGMNGLMTSASVIKTLMTAKSGTVFIQFQVDASTSTVGTGFRLEWNSNLLSLNPPQADFIIPNTVCSDNPTLFVNTSIGTNLNNQWLVNSMNAGTSKDLANNFTSSGLYEVGLIVSNCALADTVFKQVNVIVPTTAPVAAFQASKTQADLSEIITLYDTTIYCASNRVWTITPSSFVFVNGTNANSVNPQIRFTDTGCYSVSLMVENTIGNNTLTVPCFIEVINYCKPSVNNLSAGIGINRVRVANLDNSSTTGVSEYTDYTGSPAANLLAGGTYSVIISRPANTNPVSRAIWIDLNQDGNFDNTELLATSINSTREHWTASITIPNGTPKGISRMRVGLEFSSFPLTPCGPNQFGEFEDYKLIIDADEVNPVITLTGSDTIYLERGSAYSELGATATDNAEGDISGRITISGTVDEMVEGIYPLYYDVSDLSGNAAMQATRIVVVTPDITAPTIALAGFNPDTLELLLSYQEPGFNAMDLVDGDITQDVIITGNIDSSVIGVYTLQYKVTDASGNSDSTIRTIVVVDRILPVVTLLGADSQYVEVFNSYVEEGATASDNYDANPTLTQSGFVNTNRLGTYQIQYCATDQSGNRNCESRIVLVGDTTRPILQLAGNNPDTVLRWQTYQEPGYLVNDNYDLFATVTIGGDAQNTSEEGEFVISYVAVDNSGNVSDTLYRKVVITENLTSVYPIQSQGEITIYPNPSSGVFNLNFGMTAENIISTVVYNALGMEQLRITDLKKDATTTTLDLSGHIPGVYFVVVQTASGVSTHKIILN